MRGSRERPPGGGGGGCLPMSGAGGGCGGGGGGGGSSRGSSSSLEPPARPLPPRQFCERYSLPRVVQVSGGSAEGGPLGGPLLLYARYRGAKARARSLRSGNSTSSGGVGVGVVVGVGGGSGGGARLTPAGPALAVPRGYQGWFVRLSPRGRPLARRFTSLQQLVAARVPAFLTQRALSAYRLSSTPPSALHPALADGVAPAGRGAQYVRTSLRAGSVLRLLGVFEDLKAPASPPPAPHTHAHWVAGAGGGQAAQRRSGAGLLALLGRRASGNAADKYAQCVCPKGQVVFVPLSAAGVFYAVLSAPSPSSPPAEGAGAVPAVQCAARADVLLARAAPPLAVRLAAGPLPHPLPLGFTGDLLLEGFEEEEVILAVALPADWASPRRLGLLGGDAAGAAGAAPGAADAEAAGLRLLEIDADARFLVARALPSSDAERRLFHTPLLRAALALCRERGDAWRCQVKVTHHICPRMEPAPVPPPPDAPLPPTPPSAGAKAASRDSSGRLQRSLAKLRFPTKKSSSFTYTANVRPEPSPSPAASPAPAPPPRNPAPPTTRAWGGGGVGGGVNGGTPALVALLADEVPYSHAVDALPGTRSASRGADENLYAEICDAPPRPPPKGKLESFYHLKVRSVERTKEDCYYVQLDDGRYAGTLCSRAASEGDYDTVC